MWQAISAELHARVRPPVVIVLGSPREAAELAETIGGGEIVCYQMDLYQTDRLHDELRSRNVTAQVVTAPDLWDLPDGVQTALYPVAEGGERNLKIDMIEQAFHVLRQRGSLVVLSPYEREQLIPGVLKKVFGRVRSPAAGQGMLYWSQREGDRSRRRHEVVFQVRADENTSLRFLSRPGVFSFGRFDEGGRALVESMVIHPGDRVLDLGCGCGTNGVIAGLRGGPECRITFLDSNVRAIALAEHNARANGLPGWEAVASSRFEGLADSSFDVVLANPPYYAQSTIAYAFIQKGRDLLRRGGRFYLVTRQPGQIGPLVEETFGAAETTLRRGFTVFRAEVT